jgi:hypothetical protein
MAIFNWKFPLEDGHKTETCSGYWIKNIQTSVALDGNPEPDLVHAAGCKQPTLKKRIAYVILIANKEFKQN